MAENAYYKNDILKKLLFKLFVNHKFNCFVQYKTAWNSDYLITDYPITDYPITDYLSTFYARYTYYYKGKGFEFEAKTKLKNKNFKSCKERLEYQLRPRSKISVQKLPVVSDYQPKTWMAGDIVSRWYDEIFIPHAEKY
ncbi:hypothetical protein T01_12796 [Trichinella spiralis]|uniref:Uncharacterized protein n=1 Tax=Trichinella spiralis TaxID=6334 RepID=A0A0V1BXY8_TRISP|nr:hypothetical protein T01_12796 [Trichinella spiralis]